MLLNDEKGQLLHLSFLRLKENQQESKTNALSPTLVPTQIRVNQQSSQSVDLLDKPKVKSVSFSFKSNQINQKRNTLRLNVSELKSKFR